jgi:hypothetical protein
MKVGTCKFFEEEEDHHCHSCISISIGCLEFYSIINIFAKAPCHLNSKATRRIEPKNHNIKGLEKDK